MTAIGAAFSGELPKPWYEVLAGSPNAGKKLQELLESSKGVEATKFHEAMKAREAKKGK